MKFSYFLKEYVQLLNKRRKVFAKEININETELSQLLNDHRAPSENIIIRLELHSNKAIPAIAWYKLVEREKEHYIVTNKEMREREEKNVSNRLTVRL
jgi:plasmid maintenance system antidote protein VapI